MTNADHGKKPRAALPEIPGPLWTRLERQLRPRQLDAGELLFDQGQFDDRLYLLDEGLLEVSVLSASGRKLSLDRLGPGSVFGEIAIFDPGPRTARILALAPSRLRYVTQKALMAEIRREPDIAQELLRLAGQRMRWMNRQIEDQVFLAPASRLAGKILHLAGEGSEIGISQSQLAEFVGVTRELVSKTLAEWQRAGYVALSRGRIALRDREALVEIRNLDFV